MEDPARVFLQLEAVGGDRLDGAVDGVDGGVEVLLCGPESGLFSLTDLLGDALILRLQLRAGAGLFADPAGIPLVLAGVRSCVGEDTEFDDVGVVIAGLDIGAILGRL